MPTRKEFEAHEVKDAWVTAVAHHKSGVLGPTWQGS